MKKFLCYDTNDAALGKINVDSRGMLKPNSTIPSTNGAAYQQLVTDGDGNTKWEDRLAYSDSKVVAVVDAGEGVQLVKVADEIPSWASVDVPIKIWKSDGTNATISPEEYTDLGNGSFTADGASFITTDNFEFSGIMFPEKGVYFVSVNGKYITGIASADSDMPEITWDGNIGIFKTIDEKFIPDIPAEKLPDIPAEKLPDIPAEKLPDIPVIEFNQSIADTIEGGSQPSYNVSNFNYSELLNIFNRKNFLIKDTEKYYSPSEFSIFNGILSIKILVLPKGSDDHLCYASLSCAKDTNKFYRNSYFTISAIKK